MAIGNWYKTDNVAKVFLATYNRRDSRTMRLSCTLTEEVNEEMLQKAVEKTMQMRPQFRVRIRRGLFWHYLEATDFMPVVSEESGRPCPLLYGKNYAGVLHFKITYFGNRINLDIFHALSDGTGALEFLNVLVGHYLKIAHPEDELLKEVKLGSGASEGDLSQDSFDQFYEKTKLSDALNFTATDYSDDSNEGNNQAVKPKKAYHFYGRKLPYDQLQFIEIKMQADDVLPLAKELGVSIGSYMGAQMMLAMYRSMPGIRRKMPITVSIPVNLRNYYNSKTVRNFFNSISISHTFTGEETIETLAKEFDHKLKESITPEKIRQQMDRYQKIERLAFVRMVPLVIKQPVVRNGSKNQNKRVSFVLSNLGVMKPAEEHKKYIESFSAFCSHEEIFITINSFRDELKLGVTYAYSDTTLIKDLVRAFSNEGIEVIVNSTDVARL